MPPSLNPGFRPQRRRAAASGILARANKLFLCLSAGFLFSLSIAVSAPARQITGAGFTYYVLSLYWLPMLCLESAGADECQGSPRTGFVVHSLSPSLEWNSPVNCGGNDVISGQLVGSMRDLMPTRTLVEREWIEHGTCSGLSPEAYFAAVRGAFASVNIPQLGGGVHDTTPRTHDIAESFRSRDPALFPQAMSITCSEHSSLKLPNSMRFRRRFSMRGPSSSSEDLPGPQCSKRLDGTVGTMS
ncbi:MAG: hypothetical protein WDM77_07615 [Steroidobacteraceae bacterium]